MGRRGPPASPMEKRFSIRRIPLDASAFVTFGDGHEPWPLIGEPFAFDLNGVFVRLRPPPGTSASTVEHVKAAVMLAGASAVKVEHASAPAVVVEKHVDVKPGEGLRPLVLAMGQRANTANRSALMVALEAALAAAGL